MQFRQGAVTERPFCVISVGSYSGQKYLSLLSRAVEVESAFGNVKGNFGIRRFTLKGLPGATLKWGLHSIAHNLRKMALLAVQEECHFFVQKHLRLNESSADRTARGRADTALVSTRPLRLGLRFINSLVPLYS